LTPPRAVIRELAIAWLHLAVLWMFAFARPLFEVLEDSPAFFVARGNATVDIVLLAIGFAFVPPSLMVLCEAALIPLRSVRRGLHLSFVALLLAAIALQILDGLASWPALILILALVVAGAGGAWAYARTRVAPAVLSVVSPVPVLIVGYFLFLSPVSDLVMPQDVETVASAEGGTSTPVVFVVFDEFSGASLANRSGKVDASRFPNLAAFSGDSTWYRNATTVADETTAAVPALLAGVRPHEGSLPIALDYPENLFTALDESHSLNVVEPATDLSPRRLCSEARPSLGNRLRGLADDLSVVSAYLLLPADLEDGLPEVDRTFASFRKGGRDDNASKRVSAGIPIAGLENRPGQFARFLRGIDGDTAKPQLDFLHLGLPHLPWQHLPSGKSYDVIGPDPPGLSNEHWAPDGWLTRQGYQRYLLQLGYVDRLLGRLMDRLRAEGLYDRSLIVVTADHGISFRADLNRRVIVPGNAPDIASVPLFVKKPGQGSGRVDEAAVRTIDVLPTVAEVAGVRLPPGADGRPLGRAATRDDRVRVSSYTGNPVALSFADFVRRRDAEVARRLRLFPGDGFDGVFESDQSAAWSAARYEPYPPLARRASAWTSTTTAGSRRSRVRRGAFRHS
jgi:Sulfatase